MRITAQCILLALAGLAVAAPLPAKSRKDPTVTLERLLVGEWIGKPSVGDIAFREDGTFAQKSPSPRESVFEGKWNVKWDALPPTLVLTGKLSTDKSHIEKTLEMQITHLNDKEFQFTAGKDDAVSFKRRAK